VHTGCIPPKRPVHCAHGVYSTEEASSLCTRGVFLRRGQFIVHTGCIPPKSPVHCAHGVYSTEESSSSCTWGLVLRNCQFIVHTGSHSTNSPVHTQRTSQFILHMGCHSTNSPVHFRRGGTHPTNGLFTLEVGCRPTKVPVHFSGGVSGRPRSAPGSWPATGVVLTGGCRGVPRHFISHMGSPLPNGPTIGSLDRPRPEKFISHTGGPRSVGRSASIGGLQSAESSNWTRRLHCLGRKRRLERETDW